MSGVLPIQAIQADEIRTIALRHGVERVRVFGSVARGEARPGSDVDLLIRLQPGHGFSDFMAFCREVEAALGRRVDVVTEDGLSPYLRDRVLAEAIPL
jgi:predicted nucleotidyltransferase